MNFNDSDLNFKFKVQIRGRENCPCLSQEWAWWSTKEWIMDHFMETVDLFLFQSARVQIVDLGVSF